MATDNLEICNLALAKIGVAPIASMAEASREARLCSQFYPNQLALVLRRYRWQFARVRLALTPATAGVPTPYADEYDFAYDLPTDCLSIRRMLDGTLCEYNHWAMVNNGADGMVLLTSAPSAILEYTRLVEETTVFPQDFTELLALSIAKALVIPLQQDKQLAAQLDAEIRALAMSALSVDSSFAGRETLGTGYFASDERFRDGNDITS